MTANELREKFLRFFADKKHTIVPSSSLLPTDPSVLFTTAGMQQFKLYYLGQDSPYGKNVTSCQKCFRTSDIEEVGDNRHLTFLEMLGNFSFGGYFKEEAINWALEFLVSACQLPIEKLAFTYFAGDNEVPADIESKGIWLKLGIPEKRIFGAGRQDNFWGPTGEEGPCGPTTEIYYDLKGEPCEKGKECGPSCGCNRFIELWNLVFNEYFQDKEKKLTPLKQKGVDTGMGLERLAFVSQGGEDIFDSDLFQPLIEIIRGQEKGVSTGSTERWERIIADHSKAAAFLISEGIFPTNVEQGYVVRRILRRTIKYGANLGLEKGFLIPLVEKVIEMYWEIYFKSSLMNKEEIVEVIRREEEKFNRTLKAGLKRFEKLAKTGIIIGTDAFHLYDTYGFPLELTLELAKERDITVEVEGFETAFKKHQEISRAGAEKKFGGVGKDASYEMVKLHTATHLLHQALRNVLGDHVQQMGSDITPQRLRFDFSHSEKLTARQIAAVEQIVNQKIQADLPVKKVEMKYSEAIEIGALAFFKEKYPAVVTVYFIGDPARDSGQVFSKEVCAGPHVNRTAELGSFKIEKEESSGAGTRRIRAVLANE